MDLHVHPHPGYIIDKQARLYHCENEMLRLKILADLQPSLNTDLIHDIAHPYRRYIRCNQDQVVCIVEQTSNVID